MTINVGFSEITDIDRTTCYEAFRRHAIGHFFGLHSCTRKDQFRLISLHPHCALSHQFLVEGFACRRAFRQIDGAGGRAVWKMGGLAEKDMSGLFPSQALQRVGR